MICTSIIDIFPVVQFHSCMAHCLLAIEIAAVHSCKNEMIVMNVEKMKWVPHFGKFFVFSLTGNTGIVDR